MAGTDSAGALRPSFESYDSNGTPRASKEGRNSVHGGVTRGYWHECQSNDSNNTIEAYPMSTKSIDSEYNQSSTRKGILPFVLLCKKGLTRLSTRLFNKRTRLQKEPVKPHRQTSDL